MSGDKQAVDRIMGLRAEVEKLDRDVVRLESAREAAQARVAEAEEELRGLGFDPAGDLNEQLAGRAEDIETGVNDATAELERIAQEAGS